MKNQPSKILFMFISMGFVLLGIGCSTGPSPNSQSNSNQNTSNQISTSNKTTPTPLTCTLSEEELVNAIPNNLKDQYNKNFWLSFAGDKLVFKGSIYSKGNGNVLGQLLNAFDKFRGKDCISAVSFQSNSENDKFKWCPEPECLPRKPAPDCYVRNVVENSRIKYQLDHTLFYDYDIGNDGVLEFMGFVGDKPKSGQFNSLFGQLQQYMNNGCITKITFSSESKKDEKALTDVGFEWMLCESPNCECAGECKNCELCSPDANTNTNGNANRSNSP
jgi:hypothetical protein